jgi:hypothetical protein
MNVIARLELVHPSDFLNDAGDVGKSCRTCLGLLSVVVGIRFFVGVSKRRGTGCQNVSVGYILFYSRCGCDL